VKENQASRTGSGRQDRGRGADIGSIELRSRYLKNSRRNMRGYEFYRVAVAESCNMAESYRNHG